MISKIVFEKILKKGLTIGFAESMTGGSLCAEMIKNPGASEVTPGGIIAYSEAQKMNLLKIDSKVIESFGVVSKEVAIEMAKQIRTILGVDIGVSVTGNAGPTLQKHSKNLEAFIGFSYLNQETFIHIQFDALTRKEAIEKAVKMTYSHLEKMLEKIG
ncbi:MAG: CinA family protein [Bacillota bacterium]|nr:MAG: CinA family protein [Bacillota bacterium]